ncbi:arabinose efflux permease family protein [Trypanosoma rangeli]|uniref:Arabinose efflux permease family protein n=1 Tax=Trypanosoma rangeli TaxID=5698 RepID=A0A3S5IQU5_TRYRA|nr:arabinose efflux permease family protein [Trypanosoma rangeli]RNF02433.1 arabinose efflux permease family protein [Trypanosoma rangeli]|eukprot:RNF02433.1 arabinose efflux permease family protein [Trypanosoma rangeli]
MPILKVAHSDEKRRFDPSGLTCIYEHTEHEENEGTLCSLKRQMSMKELLLLLSMSFSYALCFNTLNNIVIPKIVGRLGDNKQSLWLGLLMVLGALCQMSAPLVGAYSDRVGNRALFLVSGSAVTVMGLFMFILVELTDMVIVLCLAQVLSTVGLSVIYSMVMALLTDYVLEEQTGKGSGAMALLALTGSGVGYAMLAADVPVKYCLCSYVIVTLLCLTLTLNSIPIVETLRPAQQPARFCDTVIAAFTMPSFRVFPDFFLACVGRALFNGGLASQVYLVFFVRDVFLSTSPVRITSALSIAALIGGLLGAIPSGVFSDRIGRKPVVYAALFLCTTSLVLLVLVRDIKLLYVVGFLHGFGSASYLSVDHALGILTLPRKCGFPIDAAKDLGLFATSATFGTLVGQVAYGTMLQAFVGYTETGLVRYSYFGFIVIFILAAVAFIVSGTTVVFIRLK